jgi:phosphatidylglycerophosphatase C
MDRASGPIPQAAPVAAFDLDGTITWADAFTSFLRARAGRGIFWSRVIPLAPLFPAYLAGVVDRKALKELFAQRLLGGGAVEKVAKQAEDFWTHIGAKLLRADALAEIERRKALGDRIVIVTACPEIVAAPIARRLGAELIGTRLAVHDGRLTGDIEGENCRGAEKVARLEAAYGPDFALAAAYGDSSGDRELLARAEDGRYRVFRDGPRPALLATMALWL